MSNKKRLLLISNSINFGSEYLDHCQEEILSFLGKDVSTVLFFPYAKPDIDEYVQKARGRFEKMGLNLVSIHESKNPEKEIKKSEAIFIGGGNTFLLLKKLYDKNLFNLIKKKINEGIPYIGTSAGSNITGISIATTNDMPIAYPPSFDALGLIPFNINPHYVDPDSKSKHKGENRIERIEEFHKIKSIPVLGLREGAILLVEGRKILLKCGGAKVFLKNKAPYEKLAGSDLSLILNL